MPMKATIRHRFTEVLCSCGALCTVVPVAVRDARGEKIAVDDDSATSQKGVAVGDVIIRCSSRVCPLFNQPYLFREFMFQTEYRQDVAEVPEAAATAALSAVPATTGSTDFYYKTGGL